MKYEAQAQAVLDLLDNETVRMISTHRDRNIIPLALEDELADMLIDNGVPLYDAQAGYHALCMLATKKYEAWRD